MSKRKRIITLIIILVLIICIGGITLKIEDFLHNQEVQRQQSQEQLHKENEKKIVEDVVKRFEGIKSVTFTFIAPSKVIGGYTYSFFVNEESYKKNQDYLWDYEILDDKTIGGSTDPLSGKYASKILDNFSKVVDSKYQRRKPLKEADVNNVKINYRLKADK
ncbi:hypothetical protein [Companilactobacillus mishanensis]|uniref:Lipoprotein n=1 Tax=Companilactobacillus mishanensis TaxID=2486008 RepID=A0ABW9P860_9LACO|nr:hypothetical protein [Companilactobacillus mishanensis]MQS45346.1 hypothetical protein [Companilactobacillus mishanensis]